jgi:uncharacterized membrane protein
MPNESLRSQSALLAQHAQHVVLIHFPIALFLAGAGFDIAARWTKRATNRATFAAAAPLNILAAAVFVLPTLATGVAAWQWHLGGQRLKGLLLLHLGLGCTTHFRQRKASALPDYYLPLEILAAGVIGLAAHVGGFLSGVNVAG